VRKQQRIDLASSHDHAGIVSPPGRAARAG
jgi:hypothetical protein